MKDFLSNYGYWIFLGLMLFMMVRRGGCCGGHGSHNENDKQQEGNGNGHNGKDGSAKSCH